MHNTRGFALLNNKDCLSTEYRHGELFGELLSQWLSDCGHSCCQRALVRVADVRVPAVRVPAVRVPSVRVPAVTVAVRLVSSQSW